MSNVNYRFKVDNPTLSNEITQMKSDHLQVPIYHGATAYYLGIQPVDDGRFRSSKIKVANIR